MCRAVQLPAAGMCHPIMATTCEPVVGAKCQSVKVAMSEWRNLSALDVPANGIAVENVRYGAWFVHVKDAENFVF